MPANEEVKYKLTIDTQEAEQKIAALGGAAPSGGGTSPAAGPSGAADKGEPPGGKKSTYDVVGDILPVAQMALGRIGMGGALSAIMSGTFLTAIVAGVAGVLHLSLSTFQEMATRMATYSPLVFMAMSKLKLGEMGREYQTGKEMGPQIAEVINKQNRAEEANRQYWNSWSKLGLDIAGWWHDKQTEWGMEDMRQREKEIYVRRYYQDVKEKTGAPASVVPEPTDEQLKALGWDPNKNAVKDSEKEGKKVASALSTALEEWSKGAKAPATAGLHGPPQQWLQAHGANGAMGPGAFPRPGPASVSFRGADSITITASDEEHVHQEMMGLQARIHGLLSGMQDNRWLRMSVERARITGSMF